MGCGASSANPKDAALTSEPAPVKQPALTEAIPAGKIELPGADAESPDGQLSGRVRPSFEEIDQGTNETSSSTKQPDTAENVVAERSSKLLPANIRTYQLVKLCQDSHFDRTQVEKLYELFKKISCAGDDDGLIDKAEFQMALGLKKNLFVDRMFALFDEDGDETITFAEFVFGLSTFSLRAKREEKAKFSFRMYDLKGDDVIDREELSTMLNSTISDNKLSISPEDAANMVDITFVQAATANPDTMTFAEYLGLVQKKPQLIDFMTIASLNQLLS
uniref:EF-hand domain-containing protein n=1 Tax=Chrysotila carterae TaxID=13221 RepID=A0A7S4AYN1_CHRCT